MTAPTKSIINRLASGVPGLDAILGGGLPEFSFNLLAGGPGAGKTTLALQIAFARASAEAPALYFTVLGEPPLKMLRHAQQYTFFEAEKVGKAVRFVNLSAEALAHDLDKILRRILEEVEAVQPAVVIVDSFRTVARAIDHPELELQSFAQRLAIHLTGWQATTFLVGEYDPAELQNNPIFTVADGILWMTQALERNSIVRRIQVTKLRGAAPLLGMHTIAISEGGVRVFPRLVQRPEPRRERPSAERASTGAAGLDAMMDGGIPAGESALVVGPSGSGKSVLARQFVAAGVERGERSVVAVFEEHPGDYLRRARSFGPKLAKFVEEGRVCLASLRPLDLSVDEALADIRDLVERTGATRLVIDSLSGFELALAPSFREDFRESLFRMVSGVTGRGVTVMMTSDLVESFTELRFSTQVIEFLVDVLVLQRYAEIRGKLQRVVAVVKMRHSRHASEIRAYDVDRSGLVVGDALHQFSGILTGAPTLVPSGPPGAPPLTADQQTVLRALRELGTARPAELSRRTRLGRAALAGALRRLEQLGLAIEAKERRATVYRPQ